MNSKLIWNENKDKVFGYKGLFDGSKDFINEVLRDYKELTGKDCTIEDIMLEECISTKEGLKPNTIIPMSETDIKIDFIYKANIYEI